MGSDALGEFGPAHGIVKRILDMSLVKMISSHFLSR